MALHTELTLIAEYHQGGQFNKQDLVIDNSKIVSLHTNFCGFCSHWSSLVQSKGVGLTVVFHFADFLILFQRLFVFSNLIPIGLGVKLLSMKFSFALLSPSNNYYLPLRIHPNLGARVHVTTQPLVPPPLTFLNYCSCTALPAFSALHQTHTYSNSNASRAKLVAFTLSPILVFISGTTSPKMSDTLILSLLSKTNSRYFSSLSIPTEYHCPLPQQSV